MTLSLPQGDAICHSGYRDAAVRRPVVLALTHEHMLIPECAARRVVQ